MEKYLQTTSELFDLEKYAIKLGLENISLLSSHFGNPHLNYPTIHIAGTNGKGSTAFYISKMLQACGLKVGLFTSPHLVDFRERIQINDTLIEKAFVVDFWMDAKDLVLKLKATFFDTTTLMAFKYFADCKTDVAVIETGLGGRLDSTNIITSDYAVLTPVHFDHQKQLGNNLSSIANEKAGIIKTESKVFSAIQHKKVLRVFQSHLKSSQFKYLPEFFESNIIRIDKNGLQLKLKAKNTKENWDFILPTIASYQKDNLSLAFLVVHEYCRDKRIEFPVGKIINIISKSNWPGRLQVVNRNPLILFDVSHNISGIKKTIQSISRIISTHDSDLLLGIVNDKDAISITKYLAGKFRNIIVTEPPTSRKKDGEILLRLFENQNQKVKLIKDLTTAYEASKNNLAKTDTLIALGSHYLIGALMRIG